MSHLCGFLALLAGVASHSPPVVHPAAPCTARTVHADEARVTRGTEPSDRHGDRGKDRIRQVRNLVPCRFGWLHGCGANPWPAWTRCTGYHVFCRKTGRAGPTPFDSRRSGNKQLIGEVPAVFAAILALDMSNRDPPIAPPFSRPSTSIPAVGASLLVAPLGPHSLQGLHFAHPPSFFHSFHPCSLGFDCTVPFGENGAISSGRPALHSVKILHPHQGSC